MSWEHSTFNTGRFDAVVETLIALGISHEVSKSSEAYILGSDLEHMCYCDYVYDSESEESCKHCRKECDCINYFRRVEFSHAGKNFFAQEYLAVKDYDCDGQDLVDCILGEVGIITIPKTTIFEA